MKVTISLESTITRGSLVQTYPEDVTLVSSLVMINLPRSRDLPTLICIHHTEQALHLWLKSMFGLGSVSELGFAYLKE